MTIVGKLVKVFNKPKRVLECSLQQAHQSYTPGHLLLCVDEATGELAEHSISLGHMDLVVEPAPSVEPPSRAQLRDEPLVLDEPRFLGKPRCEATHTVAGRCVRAESHDGPHREADEAPRSDVPGIGWLYPRYPRRRYSFERDGARAIVQGLADACTPYSTAKPVRFGPHFTDAGEFQSDKYPSTPPGKVPLSTKDVTAQDLLWEYAQRRRITDPEFSEDLEMALHMKGFRPGPKVSANQRMLEMVRGLMRAAEFKEDGDGKIWDDEIRAAVERARSLGWGKHQIGRLEFEPDNENESMGDAIASQIETGALLAATERRLAAEIAVHTLTKKELREKTEAFDAVSKLLAIASREQAEIMTDLSAKLKAAKEEAQELREDRGVAHQRLQVLEDRLAAVSAVSAAMGCTIQW